MYAEDSFYTLSGAARVGLLGVTGCLVGLAVWSAVRGMRARALGVRIGVAAVAFALFVWLSPQVYYAYYRMIFDGLPAQWVIGWPPVQQALAYASFTGPQTLSAHGQGVVWWLLAACALRGSASRGPKR